MAACWSEASQLEPMHVAAAVWKAVEVQRQATSVGEQVVPLEPRACPDGWVQREHDEGARKRTLARQVCTHWGREEMSCARARAGSATSKVARVARMLVRVCTSGCGLMVRG